MPLCVTEYIGGGWAALMLLKDADTGCLHLISVHLNLNLFLCFTIDWWIALMTYKSYVLDPNFNL